jgi:hypothetical protein
MFVLKQTCTLPLQAKLPTTHFNLLLRLPIVLQSHQTITHARDSSKKDIIFTQPTPPTLLKPPRKHHLSSAMDYAFDVLTVLTTVTSFRRRGPKRFPWIFRYTPVAPAPEGCSYAYACWYYLTNRQCFNQCLGIMFRLFYAAGRCTCGRSSSRSALRILCDLILPFSGQTQWLIVLSGSYLASGLLTARDAVNEKTLQKLE